MGIRWVSRPLQGILMVGLLIVGSLLWCPTPTLADWPQWRGPFGTGVASEDAAPSAALVQYTERALESRDTWSRAQHTNRFGRSGLSDCCDARWRAICPAYQRPSGRS